MENFENQIQSQIQPEEKSAENNTIKKTKVGWLVLIILIITIFISSAFGALFGFLASRNGLSPMSFFKKNSANQAQPADITKQKIVQEDSAVIEVVKGKAPAVVSIIISKDVSKYRSFDFFSDPFGFFDQNNNNQGGNGNGTEKRKVGGGSGFFITSDGMIATNKHVVSDASAEYSVVTSDNTTYTAKVLARDPVNDIAVIKIEGNNFPVLDLGDSDSVQIGQTAIAIGNSLGEFSNTVSRGIISGLGRNLTAGGGGTSENLTNIIQTDAAINPGNSGGPLLDIEGKVIGINVAIAEGAQNIGFAIPSNQIKKAVDQVKTTGKISTPFIGVRYIPIDDQIKQANNLSYNYGNLVARGQSLTDFAVIPGSPADKAGIVENDIILEIDGQKIDEANGKTLSGYIAQHNIGDVVKLKIWHKGSEKEVSVTLEERK